MVCVCGKRLLPKNCPKKTDRRRNPKKFLHFFDINIPYYTTERIFSTGLQKYNIFPLFLQLVI